MHVRPVVYQRHAKRLNLKKLLYIKWQGKIPDPEVLNKAGMQSMHSVLKLAQIRWTGHADERLPKTVCLVIYEELHGGKALSM